MGYIVAYCEKFDRAISFAAALGGIDLGSKHVAFSEVEANYEAIKKKFSPMGYIPTTRGDKKYKVTWGYGHFGTLKQAVDYDKKYANWKMIELPFTRPKYEVKLKDDYLLEKGSGKKKPVFGTPPYILRQWKNVKALFTAPDTDLLYSVTDYGREGELIFEYVYTLAKAKSKPYKRIKLSESTEAMIVKAFDNPIDADKNIHRVYAAQSRAIADFIVGANLTVYETRRSKEKGVKNVGRVQTPTLNMIYVREKAIEDFIPSSTYGIEADVANKDGEVFTIKLRQDEPFKTEEESNAFISAFTGKSFKCAMYEAKEALEYAPNPYDTTSLQIDASRKYGYSATDTLNAMQALYQPEGGKAGYITYPRTDSKFLMEEKKGEDFFRRFKGIEHISRFSSLLKYKNLHDRYFNNKKVEDHDAIIITGVKPDGIKSEIQKNIYSMIALRMIALTYPPAKLLKIKAGFVDKDGNKWVSSGIKILEEGYLEVFPKEQGAFPPHMEKGEMFKLLEMRTREMKAKKPSRYTEGTLVQAMENCASLVTEKEDKIALAKGIGRSATRAPTIEGLKTKGYISVKKNQIYLEEKGRRLIETISVEEVKSPMLTANWEKQLDEIENAEEGDIAKAVEMTVRFIKNIENQVGEWVTRV